MKSQNDVVLITGGTSGIGLEFARQLVLLGNQVIVTGRDPKKLDKLRAENPKIEAIQSDVTRADDLDSLFKHVTERYPNFNILINNAGVGHTVDLRTPSDPNALVAELRTNLEAPIQLVQPTCRFGLAAVRSHCSILR